jgi:sulfonate transport system permease protein
MSGIQGVDRKLVEVGRVYRLNGLQLVRRVLLPATLPSYLVGLRSGLGLGWMFVIAAELMGASKGLGFLLVDGQMTGRPQVIIGSIVLLARLLRKHGAGAPCCGLSKSPSASTASSRHCMASACPSNAARS